MARQILAQAENAESQDPLAVIALVLSIIAIIAPLIFQFWIKYREKQALKKALLHELLSNIDGLFNGGVERPFSYKVLDIFLEKLSTKIKDESEFQSLISLYADLKDFRIITDSYWPPSKTGYKDSGKICDEKHQKTINSFLKYFNENEQGTNMSQDEFIEMAKQLRNENQSNWHDMLEERINRIL